MNVADLIQNLLGTISREFYADRPRDFFRDQTALKKAIARYGHECNTRNWHFDIHHIRTEILRILRSMREKKASIAWLPRYLESAVDQSIRERADQLNEKAKRIENICPKISDTLKPVVLVQATDVEILSTLYRQLKNTRRRASRKPSGKQLNLI